MPKNAISGLMLLADFYPLNTKKSQIKQCVDPGFFGRICQLGKTFLPSIWSALWCIVVELHLQNFQKTKRICMASSKLLTKQCLMKPTGDFSILFHFLFSPSRIFLKIAKEMTYILVVQRDIFNPHIAKWKVQLPFFTSRRTGRDLFHYRVKQYQLWIPILSQESW